MKEGKNPKILLVADYSNFHATLAKGLRRLGCDVTLVSDGSAFMECSRDIDISRRFSSKAGGMLHAANLVGTVLRKMRNFDIVSFRDPAFLDLKPRRIEWFFNLITRLNKACYLSYMSTDVPFLDMLEAPDSPLRYSEWFIDGKPNRMRLQEGWKWESWHAPAMKRLNNTVYGKIKGAVTALYEYHLAAERVFPKEKIAYGGIPIDLDVISPQVIDNPEKIRILITRDVRRKLEKGNDLLEDAARRVAERHPGKVELVVLENVPRRTYMETMRSCHVILDQMYSYTPATMALEGMASGLTVVSGAEPEFYKFIGETENFPIINSPVEMDPLVECIDRLVTHPQEFAERSVKSRNFVEKHNEMTVVASRFLNFWNAND